MRASQLALAAARYSCYGRHMQGYHNSPIICFEVYFIRFITSLCSRLLAGSAPSYFATFSRQAKRDSRYQS